MGRGKKESKGELGREIERKAMDIKLRESLEMTADMNMHQFGTCFLYMYELLCYN